MTASTATTATPATTTDATTTAQEAAMPATPDTLARTGAKAVEAYFASRNVEAVTSGDGRYTVYVPGGGETEDLQLSLASTPASRGVLARVKARRVVPAADLAKVMAAANRWNRSSPLPHVVVATRGMGDQAVGTVFLEGFLAPAAELDTDQVRRFIEAVVAGSRQFWSSPTVRDLTRPLPRPAAAAAASSDGQG
jgi:hypothetical protein